MQRKKTSFLKIFILLTFCFSLYAGKIESLGVMQIPSLMNLSGDLSKLMENVSPGSSGMLALGVTALTFNPKFKNIDLVGPIKIFLFAIRKEKKPVKLEWCVVFRKKGDNLPERIDGGKTPVLARVIDNMAVLSNSRELLDTLEKIPQVPEVPKNADLVVNLDFAKYLNEFPDHFYTLRQEMVRKLAEKSSRKDRANLKTLKSLQIKLDYLEKALAQVGKLNMALSIKPDFLNIDIKMLPLAGSELELFLKMQKKIDAPFPKLFCRHVITGAARIKPMPELQAVLGEMIEEIALESVEKESDMRYAKLLRELVKNANGRANFYLEEQNGYPMSYLQVFTRQGSHKAFDKMLEQYPKVSEVNLPVYKLLTVKLKNDKDLDLFATVAPDRAILVNGMLAGKDVAKALREASGKGELAPAESPPNSGLMMIFDARDAFGKQGKTSDATKLILDFKPGVAHLKVKLTKAMIKLFVPKGMLNPGGKKKRIRIKLSPEDLKRLKEQFKKKK